MSALLFRHRLSWAAWIIGPAGQGIEIRLMQADKNTGEMGLEGNRRFGPFEKGQKLGVFAGRKKLSMGIGVLIIRGIWKENQPDSPRCPSPHHSADAVERAAKSQMSLAVAKHPDRLRPG
ncbi:MAG: hypothetical protein JSW39_06965 [Desulfobacterales bacterium]|nr:MAG: hypothetical protein JSW39_06965 [Desulfobacterales bacterium]